MTIGGGICLKISAMFRLDAYDFELPPDLIAQYPAQRRDESRLLVIRRTPFSLEHRKFREITDYFSKGDLLILNKSKVIKARIYVRRASTGGKVELLVVRVREPNLFEALVKPGRKAKPGEKLELDGHVFTVVEHLGNGKRLIELPEGEVIWELMEKYGKPPLPPYIHREASREDEERYQTVYAEVPGSIAAPTAGLHFTRELLDALADKGVKILYVVLHVGIGTFKPIKVDDIRQHVMDPEYYEVPDEVAEEVIKAKQDGRPVTLCGTTVTRTMETWALDENPRRGWSRIFIYPPYEFKVADRLITNFHLPKSTPFILTAAFTGLDKLKKAYAEAIRLKYRFFSYGDSTFII